MLVLTAWFGVGAAVAQPLGRCAACVNAAACDRKHDSCVAECRARLFGIDPKRATCIADCEGQATQCIQAANSACRAGSSCP
jgi:hypothetical protein